MMRRPGKFRRAARRLNRYRHIVNVLIKYGFEDLAGALRRSVGIRIGGRVARIRAERAAEKSWPVLLRMALEELGPTFIKVGQLLSTRPDLVGPDYIKELERLQDAVPPADSELVQAQIEKQLGAKVEELFDRFDPEPIAAASIAQVHRARTRDGEEVVLKVRRPGIVDVIRTESEILAHLATLYKKMLPPDSPIDPENVVAEFTSAVMKEVDLNNERRNQLRFMRNFEDDETVRVPAVHEQYCAEGVLTMDYIDGIKPSSRAVVEQADLDPKLIAERGAAFILEELFTHSFFTSDPHPGNFFVLPGNVLAPFDFGQTACLVGSDRDFLRDLVIAIVDNNVPRAIRALERAEMLDDQTDRNGLARDAEALLDTYYGLPIKEVPFSQVMTEFFDMIRRYHVRPPAQFALMAKSLMTVESFALSMNPDFQILDQLRPYATRLRLEHLNPKHVLRNVDKAFRETGRLWTDLPGALNDILRKATRGNMELRVYHEHLDRLIKVTDTSANRISFALIIAALLVGSSLLVAQDQTLVGGFTLRMLGIIGFIVAAFVGIGLLVAIIRGRHL